MTDHSTRSAKGRGAVFFLLLLLALAVGGGTYWNTTDSSPSWLEKFLHHEKPSASSSNGSATKERIPPSLSDRPNIFRLADALPPKPLTAVAESPSETTEAALSPTETVPFSPVETSPPTTNATAATLPPAPHAGTANTTQPVADAPPLPGRLSTLPPQAEELPVLKQKAEGTSPAVSPPLQEQGSPPEIAPVIIYSKAKPVTRDGSVVEGTAVIPLAHPGGVSSADAAALAGGQDQMVGMGFITDLARFMASNYWPAGTHPQAHERGISTAGIKWANLRYGNQLRGFTAKRDSPTTVRQEVLSYVLMPSMVDGLYRLYGNRFFTALEQEALAQRRSRSGMERPLNGPELREMYGIYALRMQGMAGAMRTYLSTPDIRHRVAQYQQAEAAAEEARQRFLEAQTARQMTERVAGAYQEAVIRREQARESIAASLRRGGSTKGLDTDSLVFSALWLSRREGTSRPALEALASILEDCSRRMSTEGARMASDLSSREGRAHGR